MPSLNTRSRTPLLWYGFLLSLAFRHEVLGYETVQVRHKGAQWTPLQITPARLGGKHCLIVKDPNKVLSIKGLPQLDENVRSLRII